MPRVSNNYFDISSIYTPKIREREIQPYKVRVEKAEARTEISGNKEQALMKLTTLVANFNDAVAAFSKDNVRGAFNLRAAGITTDDLGNGCDYINVSVDNNVARATYNNIHVEQIATASSITLAVFGFNERLRDYIEAKTNLAHEDLAIATRPELIVNSKGRDYSVEVNFDDTIVSIKDKINSTLASNDIRANIVSNDTGEFLTITSMVTGRNVLNAKFNHVKLNDDMGLVDLFKNNTIDIPITHRNSGTDAQVTIGGITKTSPSNTINNIIDGITIELKKSNTAAKTLAIEVRNDVEPITNSIIKLIDTYNEFIEFAETQSKTKSIKGLPTPAEDATLFNSTALRQAMSNIKDFFTSIPGLPEAMSSLGDIGIGGQNRLLFKRGMRELLGDKHDPKIKIFDNVKLRNAIVHKTDDVKNLLNSLCDRFSSKAAYLKDRLKNEISASSKEGSISLAQELAAKEAFTKAQKKIDDRVAKLELMAFIFQQQMDNLDIMLDSLNG